MSRWLCSVAVSWVILCACAPLVTLAQSIEQQSFDEVRAKLLKECASLTGQGYKREALEIVVPVPAASGIPFQLELVGGVTYAVVAACDNRCQHVEVSIDDPGGNRLAQSPEKADIVIVSGAPSESGLHRGVVRAPGCTSEWCQVGFTVLRRANN